METVLSILPLIVVIALAVVLVRAGSGPRMKSSDPARWGGPGSPYEASTARPPAGGDGGFD